MPAAALLVVLASAGCGDGPGGPSHDTLSLSARATIDSAQFQSTGEFTLHLIPFDQDGNRFTRDAWEISATVASPAATAAAFDSTAIQPADTQPVAVALLIDDSGSMLNNDPDRQRVAAAQRFWDAVLGARPANLVSLLDFGRGGAPPSPGFGYTSLLQGFTSDPASLNVAADSLLARPGGGTNLYHSTQEVVAWIDSTTATHGHNLALVLITDGRPNDSTFKETLFDETRRTQIPIFAVGVGPASDQSAEADQSVKVVKELANRTGGLYLGAATPEELVPLLQVLARSVGEEELLAVYTLSPVPAPGTPVSGTVTLTGVRGTISASWSFTSR